MKWMSYLNAFLKEFAWLFTEMAPYLLLGLLFAGLLHVYFPKHKVQRYFGGNNLRSVLNAALLGIPMPLCSCGVIPTGISFHKEGASKASTVSFLISTPQTGIDSIMVTYSLLGLPFALIRPLVALFTGLFGGMATAALQADEPRVPSSPTPKKHNGGVHGIGMMLKYAFVEFLSDIAKWLLVGMLVAALIAVIIPDDFFIRYLDNPFLSMLIVLGASVPLYVCATGSVPIAAVLMLKGLSPGAALVLLMAGPATNAATISVIGNAMGRKTMMIYLVSIIGGAILFGWIINTWLPLEWFTIPGMLHGAHQHDFLPQWFKIASAVVLGSLTLYVLLKKYIPVNHKKKETPMIKYDLLLNVKGMTCNHCKMNVENAVMDVKGVLEAEIDITQGTVQLRGEDIDVALIKKKITERGYEIM